MKDGVEFPLTDSIGTLDLSTTTKAEAIFKEAKSKQTYIEKAEVVGDGKSGRVMTRLPVVKPGEEWSFQFILTMPGFTCHSEPIRIQDTDAFVSDIRPRP